MKSATAISPKTQTSANNVPVLMDVLMEKRLKLHTNRPNQATSLEHQLTNQLHKLRKANSALQIKNQQVQRYAERVQADRDVFRKQVIRLLHRSKLLEQQIEEFHKPTWNEKLSLESIKSKTSYIKIIKNYCSILLQTTYTIILQKTKQTKELIEKWNARRLESHSEVSDKNIQKAFEKRRRHNQKEVEKRREVMKKRGLEKNRSTTR